MAKRKSLKQRVTQPSIIMLTRQAKGGYIDKSGRHYTQQEGTDLLMSGKAKASSWKGKPKRNEQTFEGVQYRGGRSKGRKNLIKLDDGKVQNQHGVIFTAEEKKLLEREANKANQKRMKMLEAEGNLDRYVAGKKTDDKVRSLQLMGKESDFILTRKSKSLQGFKNKEDFEYYIENLKRVNSPTYIDDRTRLYKKNHMIAIKNVFGDDAKDVLMRIRMMKPEQYRELLQRDEMLEINYIYDPSALAGKLNQIRASLGMKIKEEPIE